MFFIEVFFTLSPRVQQRAAERREPQASLSDLLSPLRGLILFEKKEKRKPFEPG